MAAPTAIQQPGKRSRRAWDYNAASNGRNDQIAINAFTAALPPNSYISFDKTIQYALSAPLEVREGQTWTGLKYGPINQISDTTTTSTTTNATSVTVADRTKWQVGDAVTVGNATGTNAPTFTNGSAIIAAVGSNLTANETVYFDDTNGDALPTGFAFYTTYYVIATGLTADQYELSATLGGAAIVAGSAGSGTHAAQWGWYPNSNGCRQRIYSIVSSNITAITPGSGTVGTLTLADPQAIRDAVSGATATLGAGAVVHTAFHSASNVRNQGATNTITVPYNGFAMTNCEYVGNNANQKYSGWDIVSAGNIISYNMEIHKFKARNGAGEGLIVAGSGTVTQTDIQFMWGNGIHKSAYIQGFGVNRMKIEGGIIAHCNDAPTPWDVPTASEFYNVSFDTTADTMIFPTGQFAPNGTPIYLAGGTIPGGLTASTATAKTFYYIVNANKGAGTCQFSLTPGGAAIDLTGSPVGQTNAFPVSNPTTRPATNVIRGRFQKSRDPGHKAGGICNSDFILDSADVGVEIYNCWSGCGAIDGSINSRIMMDRLYIHQCGSQDDGGNTLTGTGAFFFGDGISSGAPLNITARGCVVEECYNTIFGGSTVDVAVQPEINLHGNMFRNSPVAFGNVLLNHTGGSYMMPVGKFTTGLTDQNIWIIGNMRGLLANALVIGGITGVLYKASSGTGISTELIIDGIVCKDQYNVGFRCDGGSAGTSMGKTKLRNINVISTQTSADSTEGKINTITFGWNGFVGGDGGGAVSYLDVDGLSVSIATTNASTAIGVRMHRASSDLAGHSTMKNINVRMAGTGQKAISFDNTSGFLYKNCKVDMISTYPVIDASGWDASVTVTNATTMDA